MDQKKRPGNQLRRFPQHDHRQNKHVSKVEALAGKENEVVAERVPGALQIFVGREEKALEVPDEQIVKRKHRVEEQGIDGLEPVPWRPGFIGRKAKNAPPGKRIVFAGELNAGEMP